MKRLTVLITLLLAACATPQEFMADPPDAVVKLRLPPEQAVLCMTRNQESQSAGFLMDRRPALDGGWELIVRASTTVYAIAQARSAGTGSEATIWMATHVFIGKKPAIDNLIAGC